MTNDEGSPNAQMSCSGRRVACGIYAMQPTRLPLQVDLFLGVLEFRHSFVIRHSTFVISFRGHRFGGFEAGVFS